MQHRSRTEEAGIDRQLDFSFGAIAIGEAARQLAQENLGEELELEGFVAPRSRRSSRLLVHVRSFRRCPEAGSGGQGESGACKMESNRREMTE